MCVSVRRPVFRYHFFKTVAISIIFEPFVTWTFMALYLSTPPPFQVVDPLSVCCPPSEYLKSFKLDFDAVKSKVVLLNGKMISYPFSTPFSVSVLLSICPPPLFGILSYYAIINKVGFLHKKIKISPFPPYFFCEQSSKASCRD